MFWYTHCTYCMYTRYIDTYIRSSHVGTEMFVASEEITGNTPSVHVRYCLPTLQIPSQHLNGALYRASSRCLMPSDLTFLLPPIEAPICPLPDLLGKK